MNFRSWKTSLSGAAALLAVASKIVAAGHLDFAADVPVILAALGLLAAKDHNVTGGTSPQ